MPQLHETMMGRRFIEGTMPAIAHSLEKIVELLEKNLEAQEAAKEEGSKPKSHLSLGPGEM